MKNISMRSALILILVIAASVKFSGCEQEDLDFYINCFDCLEEIPEWDTLTVTVTINEENPFVPLEFYLGDYENHETDWVDTAYEEHFWLTGKVGQEYAVKAYYKQDGQDVVAVDGDKMRLVDGEGECQPPCYYIRGGTLDVRLKSR